MMGIRKHLLPSDPSNLISSGLVDEDTVAQPAKNSPVRRKKNKNFKFILRDVRRISKAQKRRNENLASLLEASEKETDLDELDYINIQEPHISAFASLFADEENMRIWSDFMNRTEEDQQDILAGVRDLCVEEEEEEEDWVTVPHDCSTGDDHDNDGRKVHPGFSAERCYMRINRSLRHFLRRRAPPLDIVGRFEEELMCFFSEWPKSVYVSQANGCFERQIVHAISQYLNLVSKSYDLEGGKRQTQVENRSDKFLPPQTSLADYLSLRQAKH